MSRPGLIGAVVPRPRGSARALPRAAVAATVGLVVMASAQVAYPLAPSERVVLSTLVVSGAALASLGGAAVAWGWQRALATLIAVGALSLAVEACGVRTGIPFGGYAYTDRLQPQIAGVPLLVPLAWFALGAPAFDVASRLCAALPARIVAGAAALAAWDLFLDPQMLAEGYWSWDRSGPYRGIPLTNFAGWLVTAAAVMVVIRLCAGRAQTSAWLLGIYVSTAVMETIGFLVFFRDPVVGVVGGIAMGVPSLLALRRLAGVRLMLRLTSLGRGG